MKNNDTVPGGLSILLGFCAAMIILTVLQVLVPVGLMPAFIQTNVINMLLGAAGMGMLLHRGNKTAQKLGTLQELVRPLEKRDYPALALLKPQTADSESVDDESYTDLRKTIRDLGVFIEMFKTHAKGNADVEKLLAKLIESAREKPQEAVNSGAGCLGEIDSSAKQAVSALEQVELCFSSFAEMNREQNQIIEELGARLTATAELEDSMAATIEASGKNAGDLKNKINDGEEHSRNAYTIIKEAAKDLDQITEIVKTINQTSQQTNILSMNAAIESAHAGAAGAGFAVVADEIRKLAESNRINAKNIQTVLFGITRQITQALKASEVSSLAFASLTGEITGLVENLDTVAASARKTSYTKAEMKTALSGPPGETERTRNHAADIATFIYSFRAALEHIQDLCGPAQGEAGKAARQTAQKGDGIRLDRLLEYLKETEELEVILSSGSVRIPIKSAAAAKWSAGTPDADQSFRRDVAVKTPPSIVP